ncbi:MAG: asparagine synthase-related protein [Elusimicrobiota bacterium]
MLPDAILKRPKMGFGIPLNAWFRGELGALGRRLLLDPQSLKRGYFNEAVIRDMFDAHAAGRAEHGFRLWSLLCFDIWHRLYIDKTLKPGDSLR